VFERFTERARQVVVLAQDEARALGHDYIGTEHLLLGLLREEQGVGAQTLQGLGLTLEAVREQVVAHVGRSESNDHTGQIPFSPRGKRALELALREALGLGHNHIGTEHLLLGLVRQEEGTASTVLHALGRDEETVRSDVVRRLAGTARTAAVHPVTVGRRPWPVAEEVSASQLPGRRGLGLPPVAHLLAGWLLFAVALGAGILIGWAIWS